MNNVACVTCGMKKPLTTEFYYRNKANKSGFHGKCIECIKEYKKRYAKTNKHVIDKYYEENKGKINEYRKDYYIKNKEHELKEQQKYRRENMDIVYKATSKFKKKNREKYNFYYQRRRSAEKEVECNFSQKDWEKAKLFFDDKCAYCGNEERMTQDHFVPLSKGGGYTDDNIIPSCKSCNSKKHTQNFGDWYPDFEHYSQERKEKIIEYLNTRKKVTH